MRPDGGPEACCDVCGEPLELRATLEHGWPLIDVTEGDIIAMDLRAFTHKVAADDESGYGDFTVICSADSFHDTGWCVDPERQVICRADDAVQGE